MSDVDTTWWTMWTNFDVSNLKINSRTRIRAAGANRQRPDPWISSGGERVLDFFRLYRMEPVTGILGLILGEPVLPTRLAKGMKCKCIASRRQ